MALDHFVRMDGTTKRSSAVIDTDIIKDSMIDWGTGAGQVAGADVPITPTTLFTATDVEAALLEVAGKNFNTRKYMANPITQLLGTDRRVIITAANQVPTEVIANQALTTTGALLGVSHIGAALIHPVDGAAVTVEDRRMLGILVDIYGDPIMKGTGEQVFFIYHSLNAVGGLIYQAANDSEAIFVVADGAGGYKATVIPAGTYYCWPVIRFDLNLMPEDAMLYGGGGAEDLDNTPYSAGTGIAISGAYAITFDQSASLATLTGVWTASNASAGIDFGTAGYSDGIVLPKNAGAPAGAATEGAIMWDSTGDNLYVSIGASWKQISSAAVLPASGGAGETLVGDGSGGWVTNPNFVANATSGLVSSDIPDNNAAALLIENDSDGADYILISTLTGTEAMSFGNTTDNPAFNFLGTGVATFNTGAIFPDNATLKLGTAGADDVLTSTGAATSWTHNTGNLTIDNTVAGAKTIVMLGSDLIGSALQVQNNSAQNLLQVTGNAGIYFGSAALGCTVAAGLVDNSPGALSIQEGLNNYFSIATLDAGPYLMFGNPTTNPAFSIAGTGQVTIEGNVNATLGLDVTTAALTAAAALTVTGGAFTFSGSNINMDPTGTYDLLMAAAQTHSTHLSDNLASAFLVENAGGDDFIMIDTTNAAEVIALGNATSNPVINLLGTGQKTVSGNMDVTGGLDVSGAPFSMTGTNIDLDPTGTYDLSMDATRTVSIHLADNLASAYLIENAGGDDFIKIDTLDAGEVMAFGNATSNPVMNFLGTGLKTVSGNMDVTGGVDVTGADLTVGGANFAVGVDGIVDAGTWQATSVKSNYGGTGQTAYAAGDMLYWAAGTALSKLGIGTAFQILRTNAGATAPEWTSEGSMVTGSIVAVAAGVSANRMVSAHDDAGTGKLEHASAAAASTAFQVAGVALAAAGGGAAVKLQTSGVVTLTVVAGNAAITAGDTAYLAQVAGGFVCQYGDVAYTSTAYIVPIGIFLQNVAAAAAGTTLVALGGVGAGAVYVP